MVIVSPDEVGDTLVLVPSAAAAGNCLVSGDYRPQFWTDCFHIWYTPLGGWGLATHRKWSGSGHSPGGGGPKTTQIKHFFTLFIVWLKNILPHTFILFYMCRMIFVLHLNPYFVTVGHCPGGWGHFKWAFLVFLGQKNFFFCPYVMASRTRTRCRQQLLQTSSSQKLLHLQTLFFAHMLLGLVPTNFVHNSFITCTQGTQRAKMCRKKHFL